MRQLLLALFAITQIAIPDRIIARGERLAFENPETATLRPLTLPMARAEGVVGIWLAWNWERAWPGVRPLFGTVGLPALVLPATFLDVVLQTVYENPEAIELKPWVRPATRLLGLCYVLVAIWPDRSAHDG